MAATIGLWSVSTWNFLPSRRKRKCLTAAYVPRSSLSKVLYLDSAGDSFLEKKASGRQSSPSSCCSTPPTWESEASVTKEMVALGAGWVRETELTRAFFAARKAAAAEGGHESDFGAPLSRSVRGRRIPATPGKKRR